MRTYKDTFENIKKNLIDPLNCDVFIHTWDLRDHSARGDWADQHDNDFQDVVDIFRPTAIQVDEQKRYIDYIDEIIKANGLQAILNNVPNAVFSMYYKRQASFDLVEKTKKQYDLVILTRPDILLSNSDDLHSLAPYNFDQFIDGCIMMAPSEQSGVAMKYNCKKHPASEKIIGGYGVFNEYSDIFMAGSYDDMKKMSMLYSSIPEYLAAGCPLHAEKLLIHHCKVNKFKIKNLSGNFGLLREMNHDEWWKERNLKKGIKNESR